MSGSSNIDALERNAQWTLDSRCECDAPTGRAASRWACSRWASPRWSTAPTHHDVEVLYECVRCGHEFRRTYELTVGGKQRENGYYREVRKEKRRSERRLLWSSVERCFASMWDHYH
ncbi:hypothetical protein AAVH_21241 [Aphelenchoides avenae]|nr:hypothetical protein AAVH_21241 [Aphelenchus avenae]